VIRRVLCALGAVCLLLVEPFYFQQTAQAEAGRQRVPVGTPPTASPSHPPQWTLSLDENTRLTADHFKRDKDGTYISPAWIRNAEARIDGSGLQMKSRRPGEGNDSLQLRLARFGRLGLERGMTAGRASSAPDRLEISRPGITEWFRFDQRGIEQGFSIPGPAPTGFPDSPLVLEMKLSGPGTSRVEMEESSVVFRGLDGGVAGRYGGLEVFDATGARLSAELVITSGAIQIRIQDRDALYPLRVDPILTTPAWTSSFGIQVASAGDVNGDGFDDVIVASSGIAYLFQGSASGLSQTPDWTSSLGGLVAGAGDVNGDGFADILVSSLVPFGGAALFYGSPSGLDHVPDWTPAITADAPEVRSIAGAGDVNGDGFADLIIGSGQGTTLGIARLYLGGSSGPDTQPSWTISQSNPYTALGYSVAGAGDVNGDGFGDLIVGEPLFGFISPFEAPAAGRARIYLGSAQGPDSDPVWVSERVVQFGWFGSSVAGAGDVNADGYADVIVGGINGFRGTEQGVAQVFLGSSPAPGIEPVLDLLGDGSLAHLGASVASAGDVDADGFDDVLIGEPDFDLPAGTESAGRAYLYSGRAQGVATSPAWNAEGSRFSQGVGITVAGAGDVNGDGRKDVLVGSYEGAALYEGAAAGTNRAPQAEAAPVSRTECVSPSGAPVLLDASGSTDEDSTPGTQDDIAFYEWFENFDTPARRLVATGITASPTLALGSHSLTLRVTDRAGASSTLPLSIQVIDTRPPTLGFDLSRHQLWPASHRMVEIHATVTAADVCGPSSVVLMSIVSNEPADAPGPQDGFTSPDIADASLGTADFDFQLRAERLDTGDGRVYTVTYRATDASGNEATLPEQVIVPLRKGGKGSPTEGLFELHTPHSTATRR
jgi:hypothetical protein